MENASKAILLSGAVLIAVVLISLGVFVIGSQKPTIEQSKKSADRVTTTTYNSTFQKYLGQSRKGSEIKQMVIDIKTSNAQYPDSDKTHHVDSNALTMNIKTYATYKVEDTEYYQDGNIKYLKVTEVK